MWEGDIEGEVGEGLRKGEAMFDVTHDLQRTLSAVCWESLQLIRCKPHLIRHSILNALFGGVHLSNTGVSSKLSTCKFTLLKITSHKYTVRYMSINTYLTS